MRNKFPYRYRVLILLFFLTLITYLDRTCISLVGVRIKNEFHLSNEQFGWVLGAFALAYALFEIPSGMLGDRIGQKAVYIRIVLMWSLFTALTGMATGLFSLMCIRFLFGMGESGAFPTSSGVIARWFPVKETGKSVSVLIMGATVGAAVAPLIVTPLAISFGWRIPFFVNGLIGTVWVLVCFTWFKNFPSEMKRISKDEQKFIEDNRRFKNQAHRVEWNRVFKSRSILALCIMFFCNQCGNYFFIFWMPVYLQEGRHFSENDMKIITAVVFIAGISGALFSGFIIDWLVKKRGLSFGRRFIGMISLGLMGILFFITAFTTHNTLAVVSLIIAQFFYLPSVAASVSTSVDIGAENAGTVTGIMNFFGQMGAFFVAIVFGKLVDISHGFATPLFALSIVLIAGCLLWLAIEPAKQISTTKHSEKLIVQYQ